MAPAGVKITASMLPTHYRILLSYTFQKFSSVLTFVPAIYAHQPNNQARVVVEEQFSCGIVNLCVY